MSSELGGSVSPELSSPQSTQVIAEETDSLFNAGMVVTQWPAMAFPEARMIMTDTLGMQEHPASVPGARVANGQWAQTAQVTQGVTDDQLQSLGSGGNVPPDDYPAPDRYVYMATDTMSDVDKINTLFWAVKNLEETVGRKARELEEARLLCHNQATLLNSAYMEMDNLKEKTTSQAEEIRDLKAQVRQMQQMAARESTLQVSTKRGRFVLSPPRMLECTNCHWVFESEDVANDSPCAHHPETARPLPNKMVAEVYEGEKLSRKHHYWPCCHMISIETPDPCSHGRHQLRAL